jgi:hypothetical protein
LHAKLKWNFASALDTLYLPAAPTRTVRCPSPHNWLYEKYLGIEQGYANAFAPNSSRQRHYMIG